MKLMVWIQKSRRVRGQALVFLVLALGYLLSRQLSHHVGIIQTDTDEEVLARPAIIARDNGLPLVVQDQDERDFYEYHYQSIRRYVNASSALVWDARTSSGRTFGPLWQLFPTVYRANGKKEPDLNRQLPGRPYIFWGSICQAALYFTRHRAADATTTPLPHVLFFQLNENWGGLSQAIPGKTANWTPDLIRQEWKKEGCKNSTVFRYLDHPDTLLAITTQFQIFDHPKVHSLPLGIQKVSKAQFLLEQLAQQQRQQPPPQRTQLLMVNSKARSMRKAAIDAVLRNFKGTGLKNTFGKDDAAVSNYYAEMQRSKFIFSPGGLGFDCYRHWEALYLGTVPVLEHLNRTDGWFRTFRDLPVAWIDSYDNLTPAFLEREYRRIIRRARDYKYEKLTKQWWARFIQSHVPSELLQNAKKK
ncbi:expressed unknown protein [Seminavis robusta]|uniref:RXYLT1 C-terminal domain-containing protein n=1 Tax=Seminavis robusta TaxID=568900 RepID=A0A9N8HA83_9STRA|nr:expressed unknown protein [Seminavis robusta]|eukprot:Sro232_g094000.1 n/a (416) ;mRNA; r:68491-69738